MAWRRTSLPAILGADLGVRGVKSVVQPLGAGLVGIGRPVMLAAVDLGQTAGDDRLRRTHPGEEPLDVLAQSVRRGRLRRVGFDLGKAKLDGGEGRLKVGALALRGEGADEPAQGCQTHVRSVSTDAWHVYSPCKRARCAPLRSRDQRLLDLAGPGPGYPHRVDDHVRAAGLWPDQPAGQQVHGVLDRAGPR